MKKEYIFNIGIVSPEKESTGKTDFFNFVLNTRSNLEMKPQNDNKSYEENKSELYELINEVVRRYDVMKNKNKSKLSTDESHIKQNTSYSQFNEAPNNRTQQQLINKNVVKISTKYKLGIICNGYYNNRLLEIEKNNSEKKIDYTILTTLRIFTLISQKLCLLGYHVECVAYNNIDLKKKGMACLYNEGNPILIKKISENGVTQEVIRDLRIDLLNKDKINEKNEYKKNANADKYYYKIDIREYEKNIQTDKLKLNNIPIMDTPLFFENKEKTKLYILSLHDFLKQNIVENEDFVKEKEEQNVNEYIERVFLTYKNSISKINNITKE